METDSPEEPEESTLAQTGKDSESDNRTDESEEKDTFANEDSSEEVPVDDPQEEGEPSDAESKT